MKMEASSSRAEKNDGKDFKWLALPNEDGKAKVSFKNPDHGNCS